MIDRVQFENFKSLQHVTLQLGRLTALVGPNGCGKSSVLQGVHLLSQTGLLGPSEQGPKQLLARLRSIYGGSRAPWRLAYRGGTDTMVLGMWRSDGKQLRVTIRVAGPDVDNRDEPRFEIALFGVPERAGTIPPASTSTWDDAFAIVDDPRLETFASVAYLHLDANEMARTTLANDEQPRMASDGSGLASALAWMKGAAEDEFAQFTSDLRQIVPGVKRIRTLRERIMHRRMEKLDIDGQPIWRPVDESLIGDRFSIEYDDGSEVPADLLSEGTVLTLGLLTKLREPGRPRLVLLDDIDRGLHLGAQVKLVEVLRGLLELDPELQIVCTTHSPYLLDLFEPAEVRVLALDSERRTHARPLTEHPEFGKWKFGTQTGELWAALGEGWVIAGAPG